MPLRQHAAPPARRHRRGAQRGRPRRPVLALSATFVPLVLVAGAVAALAAQNQNPNPKQNQAAVADPNPNCTLVVPANPLTAQGLATPYQLVATDRRKGACHEANPAQSAFVEASVLDPATGTISVYHPLVEDRGRTPAAAPVVPTLPAG